jgi:hypothetical protein
MVRWKWSPIKPAAASARAAIRAIPLPRAQPTRQRCSIVQVSSPERPRQTAHSEWHKGPSQCVRAVRACPSLRCVRGVPGVRCVRALRSVRPRVRCRSVHSASGSRTAASNPGRADVR